MNLKLKFRIHNSEGMACKFQRSHIFKSIYSILLSSPMQMISLRKFHTARAETAKSFASRMNSRAASSNFTSRALSSDSAREIYVKQNVDLLGIREMRGTSRTQINKNKAYLQINKLDTS